MTSRLGALSGRPAVRAPAAVKTLLVLIGACALSLAVAVLNQPYFSAVNAIVHAQGAEARGLLFSSWLLLLGVPIVIWDPRRFGFTIGSITQHWRLVAGMLVAAAATTAGVLLATGPIPYSDASWFIEIVDVPVTEELVFRGVLLTGLLAILGRLHTQRSALLLAVLFNGLAFGIAHLANAASLELTFVLPQATFASLVGIGCAWLMARTGSIYPAILLHAVVNGVVVAL